MMNFKQNEEAVSPVIGVILMVAITVILAAVIAAFVFGMAGNVQTTKTVAATAQLSGNYVVVTYQGGPDHADVESVTCLVADGNEAALLIDATDGTILAADLNVGQKWFVESADVSTGNALVTVSAKFNDGTEQVILDTNLRVPIAP